MPKPSLTKAQWRALLTKLLKEGPITQERAGKFADEIFKYEPPIQERLTSLYEKVPITGVTEPVEKLPPDMYRLQTRILPYEEAFQLYLQQPERYAMPEYSYAPPVDIISRVPSKSPEELAQGIAYKRQELVPFKLSSSLQKAVSSMKRGEQQEKIDKALWQLGVEPEDLAIKPKDFVAEKGIEITPPPETSELVRDAAIAEMLWHESGAYNRSTTAYKMWRELWSKQKHGTKQAYPRPKDYFMYCFRKFKNNPEQFKKQRPKEGDILTKMYMELEDSLKEIE